MGDFIMLYSAATLYEESSDTPADEPIKLHCENQSSRQVCIFCEKGTNPLIKLPSGSLAHSSCRENRACIICGLSGMTLHCRSYGCSRVVHPWCMSWTLHHSFNLEDPKCDIHLPNGRKKREYQRLWQTRQACHKASQDPESVKVIKETIDDFKSQSVYTGQILWYIINVQYFPSTYTITNLPNFCVKEKKEDLGFSNGDVDFLIEKYNKKLEEQAAYNENIFNEIIKPEINKNTLEIPEINMKKITHNKEDDLILGEIKKLSWRGHYEEYLKYFESKGRGETDFSLSEKRQSGLRGPPKCEEDWVCGVCGDGDYEDDDLIVICSKCEMGAHMKCYGIPTVPDHDWYCQACEKTNSLDERHNLKCALCSVVGGALKLTIHETSKDLTFPNYEYKGNPEKVWVHVFCALHIESATITDKINVTGIDLTKIDMKRFSLRCQKCGSKEGACLQCQHGRCQAAFHPECAKDLFTNTRDKSGYDEVSLYCTMHKPLKLRRVLENREKKSVLDIISFAKILEKVSKKKKNTKNTPPKPKKQRKEDRPFSSLEKFQLIKAMEDKLDYLLKHENNNFAFIVKSKNSSNALRSFVDIKRPLIYNTLDPQAILKYNITVSGRKPLECYTFYKALIAPIIKKELAILNLQPTVYVPKGKIKKQKKIILRLEREKEKAKKELKFVQSIIEAPILEDLITEETYCICKKPFVEKTYKRATETEEEFEKRQWYTGMVECEQCNDWFHYECMKFKYMQVPEVFYCPNCNPKRVHLSEDRLD
ncbi:unnamed protein product [Blepharisma stoltei]|uniref:Uncharacterized protein n=1 Tax=Blepharisma stoltei TaxID=1481888 RepID=A0AAU9K6F7_9CILI|nr:unnamed protein product [Blepharisma stoltei]